MIQTARALIAWVSLALAVSSQATADLTPHAQVKAMARGVNILGYDPIWRDPAKARFRLDHLARIKQGGFDTVRVNLHAFEHMDAKNRLDPKFSPRFHKLT